MPDFIRVTSEICRVDVFRNQALVCRRARIDLPAAGTYGVRLSGLPRALDDDSVRVRFIGEAPGRVADLHVTWDVAPRDRSLRTTSEDKVHTLDRHRVELEIERERTRARARLLANVKPSVYSPTDMPERLAFSETRPVTALSAFLTCFRSQELASRDRIRAIDRKLNELSDEIRAACDELEHQSESEIEKLLVAHKAAALELEIDLAGKNAEIELSYIVPAARWIPEYELWVAEGKDEAELAVRALVAQRTGEAWPRAELSFSTADLGRSTELPTLESWRIGKAQPPKRPGWRELPDTTAELFEGFDSASRRSTTPPALHMPELPETTRLGSEASVSIRSTTEIAGRVVSRLQAVASTVGGPPSGAEPAPPPEDACLSASEQGATLADEIEEAIDEEMEALSAASMEDEATPSRGGFGGAPPSPMAPSASVDGSAILGCASLDLAASRAELRPSGAPAQAMMAAAPMRSRRVSAYKMAAPRAKKTNQAPHEAEGGRLSTLEVETGIVVTKTALAYANLRMQDAEKGSIRGQLKATASVDSLREELLAATPEAGALVRNLSDAVLQTLIGDTATLDPTLPAHAVPLETSAGSFAARYSADSPTALPADGQLHAVTVARRRGTVRRTYTCVPRESTTVYQMATFENPLDLPLLSGPVRVFRGGDFVVTSPLPTTPPKKTLTVNLGVEPGIAVARNTFFKEAAGGLLGGGTNLTHRIEIEVRNKLGTPATVQVFERAPVSFEDNVKVEITKTEPKAVPYDQKDRGRVIHNGLRFDLTLKPQETQTCVLEYQVSISSKQVLMGGNRRD